MGKERMSYLVCENKQPTKVCIYSKDEEECIMIPVDKIKQLINELEWHCCSQSLINYGIVKVG